MKHSSSSGEIHEDLSPQERLERAIRCTQQARECGDDPEQYDDAERLLAEALSLMPKEPIFRENYVGFCMQLATNFADDEDFENAIRYLQCVVTYAPDDPEAWLDLGTAYANCNMALQALEAWSECLRSLKRAKEIERECTETIAANVMIVAKALDLTLSVKEEKKALRGAIAQLIATLKVHG